MLQRIILNIKLSMLAILHRRLTLVNLFMSQLFFHHFVLYLSLCARNYSIYLLFYIILFLQVTTNDLHRHFYALGAGAIEDVRVQRDKGFGFVRYSTNPEAARAIQMGNARILCGKPIKVDYL